MANYEGGYYYAFGNKREGEPAAVAPQKISPAEAARKEESMNAGEYSKWNVNNYHWEERNVLPWIEEFLGKEFFKVNAKIKKGSFRPCSAQATGYASANLRKGKSLLTYDVNISFMFEASYEDTIFSGKIIWPCNFTQEDVGEEALTPPVDSAEIRFEDSADENASANVDRVMRRGQIIQKLLKKGVVPKLHPLVKECFAQLAKSLGC